MKALTSPFGAEPVARTGQVLDLRLPVRVTTPSRTDAAQVLLGLARTWDDLVDGFTHSFGSDHLAWQVAHDITAAWAHPQAHPQLPFLMAGLRDAVTRRARYLDGLLEVSEVLDDAALGRGHDAAIGVLEQDVADALWPLLWGLNVTARCFRCARICGDAADQQPAAVPGGRCLKCQAQS